MDWILDHLRLFLVFAAVIAYLLKRASSAARGRMNPSAGGVDTAREERTRQIQEEIRRKIQERRMNAGGSAVSPRSPTSEALPPPIRPSQTPPIDPFGGPVGRMLRKLEEAAERRAEPVFEGEQPSREIASAAAVMQRQEKLAEEMKRLEEVRRAEARRAAEITNQRKAFAHAGSSTPAGGSEWMRELRDAKNIRRAIVLREILGPPVALR